MVSFKICPICGTRAHRSAAVCATCGASLADVPETTARSARSVQSPDTDRRYGEIDLLEGEVRRRGSILFAASLGIFVLVLAALAIPLISSIAASRASTATPAPAVPTATIPIVLESNTPAPSPVMATVTPPPPPPTSTPTPSPCTRIVQPGDDLISIIFNCGHRSLDVMPLVLEMNNIAAPELIQQGQEIIVPLPTPTPDPNAAGSAGEDVTGVEVAAASLLESSSEALGAASAGPTLPPTLMIAPTETLLPGVGYHLVQPNESMVSIAFQYQTNAETLSQLNPEIVFSQCDFGLDTGGERCTVLIIAGQRLRVPVPTPLPSNTPTLTGSETPTPSATPTFNAPSLISPPNRVFFLHNELITLRWVGTGVLADDEAYLVVVEDLTTGNTFRDQTRELYFIVPDDWQSTDAIAHDYRWSIGVIRVAEPDTPRFVTDPRLFTWQGRSETS